VADRRWDDVIGEMMAQDRYQVPPQYLAPANPPISSIDQLSRGNPDLPGVAGGYSVPFAGGNLGVSGSYIPQPGGAAFDSRLTYRRQF
jgi:hypothetical protein